MGGSEWVNFQFILVKPTKYHLDIAFTTSSSPLSFTNHTILCGYTTNHWNEWWHAIFSSLLFSALHFPFGMHGIQYSSQIYICSVRSMLTAFQRRKYGIHFTAAHFSLLSWRLLHAQTITCWLKAIYSEYVGIFHRLRFLMQSKCISNVPQIHLDSFHSLVKIQKGFFFTTYKFSSVLVLFSHFTICSSFAGIFFSFCWLLGFTEEW